MPLVVLLQDVSGVFGTGAKRLQRWNELLFLEELVLLRARSAFLVKWFGTRLPLHGLHLRVAIVNIDALRSRYGAVMAGQSGPSMRINMLEPGAGLVGNLAGVLASPSGLILIASLAVRSGRTWTGILIGALGVAVGALVVLMALNPGTSAIVISGIAGGVSLGALLAAVAPGLGAETVQAIHRFTGAIAEFLDATNGLMDQLLGPRDEVRNPLLRRLLEIGDRLAQLIPLLIAAWAVVVARAGPLLRPLAAQIPLFFALFQSVAEIVAEIIRDLGTRLADVISGARSPMGVLRHVFQVMLDLVGVMRRGMGDLLASGASHLQTWWNEIQGKARAWWGSLQPVVDTIVIQHPTMQAFQAAASHYRMTESILSSMAASGSGSGGGSSSSSSSGGGTSSGGTSSSGTSDGNSAIASVLLPSTADITQRAGGAPVLPLDMTSITGGATLLALARTIFPDLIVDPFAISQELRDQLDSATGRRTVFGGEWHRLRDAQGRSMHEQLAALRRSELPYRNMLYLVVSRVLPEAAAAYVVELDDVFRRIDQSLYDERREARDFTPPVREILESRRLQPVVQTLRVRVTGGDRDQGRTRAFADNLSRVLREQPYVADA